nr:hypothetical protein HK105_000642 [Polyrhizophydium stewartii]
MLPEPHSITRPQVALDVGLMQTGDFRNISHFETKMSGCIECTTTVYSFGRRILETRERRTPLRSRGQAFLYQFDLVQQFFTSFFNGSQMLDNAEEARLSIENLSILQVFEGTDAGRPVLACIAFEFLCGTGDVEAARLVKFGDVAPAAE